MFQVRRIEAVYDDDDGWILRRGIGSSVGFDHRVRSRIGFRDGCDQSLSPSREGNVLIE